MSQKVTSQRKGKREKKEPSPKLKLFICH